MTSAESEKLILDNQKLVYFIYGKLEECDVTRLNKDDIISEGMIGLLKAAKTFNPSRGVRFSTYAYFCILNEMKMYLRKLNYIFKHEMSIWTPIGRDDNGNELFIADVVTDTKPTSEQLYAKIQLEEIMARQQPIDQKILNAVMQGYTQNEIAGMCNMQQASVSRRIRKLGNRYLHTQNKARK